MTDTTARHLPGTGAFNRLVLNTQVHRGQPQLRPTVDGLDLLNGYTNAGGLDPDALLPPSSLALLPTRARGL